MTFYTTQQVSKELGVSTRTIERWRASGKLKPEVRTAGNHSRYSENQIQELKCEEKKLTLEDLL